MINIQQNINLKKYTTFKIGGPAKYFVEIKSLDELKEAVQYAKKNKLEIFVLGGGSNILISDDGFNGLVIKLENCVVSENLSKLIQKKLTEGFVGMQNLFGIPGSVGGAVRGNAGAWGSQMSDFVESVTAFGIDKLEEKVFSNLKCDFSYRSSIFKTNPNLVIWSVKFNLRVGTARELSEAQETIKQNLQKRNNSQPKHPSAGCVFQNLKQKQFEEFIQDNPNLELPASFIQNQAIPVAWLIDQLSLKGTQIGGAEVSEKHANFIINKNNASAEDVVTLISLIKSKVRDKFKTQLQEEIQLIGF